MFHCTDADFGVLPGWTVSATPTPIAAPLASCGAGLTRTNNPHLEARCFAHVSGLKQELLKRTRRHAYLYCLFFWYKFELRSFPQPTLVF